MNALDIMIVTILAVVLCIVGILLVLFELAMLGSEWSLFLAGGWRVFLVFVLIGVAMLVGGVLILLRTFRKR